MDAGHKVLCCRELHFLNRNRDRPGLPAGVDDFVGGDAVQPGAEGRPLRPVAGQCPQDCDEDGLGQVHGVLLAAGLTVDEAVDFVIVGLDQLLRRLPGVSPLDSPDPCLFPLHRLTAFHRYIRVSEYHRFRGIKRIFTGFGADDPKSPPPFGRESIVPGYSQGQFHAEARTRFARPEGQKNCVRKTRSAGHRHFNAVNKGKIYS